MDIYLGHPGRRAADHPRWGSLFGIHPVHLGIIFLANLELGYLTPPVGHEPVPGLLPVQRADHPGLQGRAGLPARWAWPRCC
ncbi:MAG: hypothetical protein MZU84_06225 [Sphingobacterium sp.]|nr:hypothetical protein [Sphingobacterium sp.]